MDQGFKSILMTQVEKYEKASSPRDDMDVPMDHV